MRTSYETCRKNQEKYRGVVLNYEIARDENSDNNYQLIKDLLDSVGVYFNVTDNHMKIMVMPETVSQKVQRNAGRRGKIWFKSESKPLYYSDVVYMMQTMKDAEIREKFDIPIATFTRHKKKMLASSYYKALDSNRLTDLEYLESASLNRIF